MGYYWWGQGWDGVKFGNDLDVMNMDELGEFEGVLHNFTLALTYINMI